MVMSESVGCCRTTASRDEALFLRFADQVDRRCRVRIDGGHLWEVRPGHHKAVGGPLQGLPHAVIEAQRGPVQGPVNLSPVEPKPEAERVQRVGSSFKARK